MKDADFQNLLQGIREAGSYLSAVKKAATKKMKSKPPAKADQPK